jgi:hypothetical protein
MYYLIDLERSISTGYMYYWKAARRGYTTDIEKAGTYPEAAARDICERDFDNRTIMISEKVAEKVLNDYL